MTRPTPQELEDRENDRLQNRFGPMPNYMAYGWSEEEFRVWVQSGERIVPDRPLPTDEELMKLAAQRLAERMAAQLADLEDRRRKAAALGRGATLLPRPGKDKARVERLAAGRRAMARTQGDRVQPAPCQPAGAPGPDLVSAMPPPAAKPRLSAIDALRRTAGAPLQRSGD